MEVPFDRIQKKFRKRSRIVPKKTFDLASTFGSKTIRGLVRESNPWSPASQIIS